MHDLYPVLVDQIARDRLRADRVRLAPSAVGRATAIDLFLEGLTAPDAALPRHSGLAALDRRLADWVDGGLAHRTRTTWTLGLHLDERDGRAARARALAAGGGRPDARPARLAALERATTTSSPSSARATRAAT